MNWSIMALAWTSASSSVLPIVSIKRVLSGRGKKEGEGGGQHTVHVNNGQVGSANDHALAHDQAQAAGAAGDDADLALE